MSVAEMTFQDIGQTDATPAALRLLLMPGEAIGLPNSRRSVHVLSDVAWVTRDGEDIILSAGQSMEWGHSTSRPVVACLGKAPLLFEVL